MSVRTILVGLKATSRIGFVMLGVFAAVGCGYPDREGFVCGVPISAGSQTVRVCDGPGEVCVCATGKCARRDDSCSSGLVYLEPPFGLVDSDGGTPRCVADDHVEQLIRGTDEVLRCVTQADAGADPAMDGAVDATTGDTTDAVVADAPSVAVWPASGMEGASR